MTMHYFLSAFTSNTIFLLATNRGSVVSLKHAIFRQIYYHHQHTPKPDSYNLISINLVKLYSPNGVF